MTSAQNIILHHYKQSPFSEKVRLALRLKNLAWAGVEVPTIMPKPDLMPLTGGYRRTPVLQIRADIFCDTALILREFDRRYKMHPLALPGHNGLANMVANWSDKTWFRTSAGVIFGTIGDDLPDAFIQDRAAMTGSGFDIAAMKQAAPMLRDQWRSQLFWIEQSLQGGQSSGAGKWLLGTKPSILDVHAYMNPWFVEQMVPDFLETCFDEMPLAYDWYQRLKAINGPESSSLSAQEALDIAQAAAPVLKPTSTDGELRGLEAGDRVAVAPDDYAQDWVEGDLVSANPERIILAYHSERAENLHIHFPRVGYHLRQI